MSNHTVNLNREGLPITCEHPDDEPCVPTTGETWQERATAVAERVARGEFGPVES